MNSNLQSTAILSLATRPGSSITKRIKLCMSAIKAKVSTLQASQPEMTPVAVQKGMSFQEIQNRIESHRLKYFDHVMRF